ncbi:hypothetical protein [Methylobacterium gossipiicola]|uniref:Uncharacterized protein n=1 Tax=Methylobacterium gossipiicola TaxID=582675 RepID=A0A1I2U3X0_9HYPH|nr:hypothetical protein [Methylobacterium gossipiicola]SFG70357.1 hypothetical protein SAMN05192565_108161 [Methylobacterium gossipiicola]
MTVLKLSSLPAGLRPDAIRTNLRFPTEFRLPTPGRRSLRKAQANPSRAKPSRPKTGRDANVALIMAVMMSLVFAPVLGMHLFATFGAMEKAQKPAPEVVSQAVRTLPPG